MTTTCSELFYSDKDPSDETMSNCVYNSLVKAHPEEISKIENNTAGGWKKFWSEAIQSVVSIIYCDDDVLLIRFNSTYSMDILQARSELRTKQANYVRNIKSAISNTFGQVFIGDIPG